MVVNVPPPDLPGDFVEFLTRDLESGQQSFYPVERTLLIVDPNAQELVRAGVTSEVLARFIMDRTGIRPFYVSLPRQERGRRRDLMPLPAYINFYTEEQAHRAMDILRDHMPTAGSVRGTMPLTVGNRHYCDIYDVDQWTPRGHVTDLHVYYAHLDGVLQRLLMADRPPREPARQRVPRAPPQPRSRSDRDHDVGPWRRALPLELAPAAGAREASQARPALAAAQARPAAADAASTTPAPAPQSGGRAAVAAGPAARRGDGPRADGQREPSGPRPAAAAAVASRPSAAVPSGRLPGARAGGLTLSAHVPRGRANQWAHLRWRLADDSSDSDSDAGEEEEEKE